MSNSSFRFVGGSAIMIIIFVGALVFLGNHMPSRPTLTGDDKRRCTMVAVDASDYIKCLEGLDEIYKNNYVEKE